MTIWFAPAYGVVCQLPQLTFVQYPLWLKTGKRGKNASGRCAG